MSAPPTGPGRLVLLHGFTGSAAGWGTRALGALRSSGVEPRALDLPGHGSRAGEADPSLFTLERVVEGIAAELAVEGRTALLGYSMGGRLALHVALRHPERVRALVLESASPGLATAEERAERRAGDEALAERIERDGVDDFVDFWESLPLFASHATLPPEERDALRRVRRDNDGTSLAAALRGLGTGSLPSLWERLPEVRVPVLVLTGELDRKFAEIGERMAAALPRAERVVVPGAGHGVHRDRPEAWARAVAGFLA